MPGPPRIRAEAPTRAFFFNVADTMTYVSLDLDEATNLVWVYDDVLVGGCSSEVIAFTPDAR